MIHFFEHPKYNMLKMVDIDAICQSCCLEEEDTYHMVTRCPAFYDIRVFNVERLK